MAAALDAVAVSGAVGEWAVAVVSVAADASADPDRPRIRVVTTWWPRALHRVSMVCFRLLRAYR